MENYTKPSENKAIEGFLGLLISLGIGLAFLCFMLAAVSAVFVFTEAPEHWEQTAATLIVAVCALVVGCLCARRARARGFLWGLVGGFLFGILLWLLGCLFMAEGDKSFPLQSLIIASGAGSFGGVVGINLKKNK